MLELNKISYRYSNFSLSVQASLPSPSWCMVWGKSGSGKSTFLKFLGGFLEEADLSTLRWEDQEYDRIFEGGEIGYVSQNPQSQLFCHTVLQELVFPLENLGLSREEIHARLEWALDVFELEDYLKLDPVQLSGGEQQFIVMVSVLMSRPKLLLLDEVTSMLSPSWRSKLFKVLVSYYQEYQPLILQVSHDEDDSLNASHLLLFQEGEGRLYEMDEYFDLDLCEREEHGFLLTREVLWKELRQESFSGKDRVASRDEFLEALTR